MNTSAIDQAILLKSSPEELAYLCYPESKLPDGITQLLNLCTSKKQIREFADKNNITFEALLNSLLNFIELVMVNEKNCKNKILGLTQESSIELRETHYELLMEIYNTNIRPSSTYYSEIITNAYDELKNSEDNMEAICFSDNRYFSDNKHSINHLLAKQNSNSQTSTTKTLLAVALTVSIFSLVGFMGKSYSPENSELAISQNDIATTTLTESQNLIKVSTIGTNNKQISPETFNHQITDTEFQALLTELENAYEEGNVDVIKPIIANSPEIQTQSRYKFVGEEKWLTREGIATITADNAKEELKITQLVLENTAID